MHERIRCEQVEVGIAGFFDATLPGALHQRFEAHLRACADCSEHLQRIRWTIDHLAALPREAMPPGMKERLLAVLRSDLPPQPPPRSLHSRPDTGYDA